MTYVALADVRIVGGGALVAGSVAHSTRVHSCDATKEVDAASIPSRLTRAA